MPIKLIQKGDLFKSTAEAVVITTNCVGIMGKGIALTAKHKWPALYEVYKRDCARNTYHGGDVIWYFTPQCNAICFMTKEHWSKPSQVQWIIRGLQTLRVQLQKTGCKSIAIPPLGCGNGGLKWTVVRPLIEKYLGDLDCEIEIYEP